jgi:hypothetical protein
MHWFFKKIEIRELCTTRNINSSAAFGSDIIDSSLKGWSVIEIVYGPGSEVAYIDKKSVGIVRVHGPANSC